MNKVEVTHIPHIADENLSELKSALESLNAEVTLETREPGLQGAIEWALPAILIMLIGKPFLDGFMGELGANVASKTKAALVGQYRKMRGKEPVFADSNTIKEALKLPEQERDEFLRIDGKQSCFVDIEIDLEDPEMRVRRVSFKIPTSLTDSEFTAALEKLSSLAKNAVSMQERNIGKEGGHVGVYVASYGYTKQRWVDLHSGEELK